MGRQPQQRLLGRSGGDRLRRVDRDDDRRPGQRDHHRLGGGRGPPDAPGRPAPPAPRHLVGRPVPDPGVARRARAPPRRTGAVVDGRRPDPGRPPAGLLGSGPVHGLGDPSAQPLGAPPAARHPPLGLADRRAGRLLPAGRAGGVPCRVDPARWSSPSSAASVRRRSNRSSSPCSTGTARRSSWRPCAGVGSWRHSGWDWPHWCASCWSVVHAKSGGRFSWKAAMPSA